MIKKYSTYGEKEKPFNMAIALLDRCDLLFRRAHEAAVNNDNKTWAKVLDALKRAIMFKLDDDELIDVKEKMDELFESVNNKLIDASAKYSKLDEFETILIMLMYKYDLYYPKYTKASWQDRLDIEYE